MLLVAAPESLDDSPVHEVVLAVALIAAAALAVRPFRGRLFDNITSAIAQLVSGYRPDSLPRGMQEENPERPWGRGSVSAEPGQHSTPISDLSRVRPTVHSR
jgi:hypothetical protein